MELSDRQKVQHALLHVLQPVVVALEDLGRGLEVETARGELGPRQVRYRFQVGANNLRLSRLAGDSLQPPELAVDLLACLLGKLECFQTFAEFLDFLRVDVLAELLVDGLQLLAEKHLPLPLAQLLLHLAANLLLCLEDADLPLEVHEELSKPVLHRESLEKLLLLLGVELGVERDEVRQLAGLGDPADQVIDDLLRDSAKTAQLGRSLAHLLVERGERRLIGIERRHVVHAPADDLHVPVLERVLERRASDLALDHHLDAAGHPLHLGDPRDRSDAV